MTNNKVKCPTNFPSSFLYDPQPCIHLAVFNGGRLSIKPLVPYLVTLFVLPVSCTFNRDRPPVVITVPGNSQISWFLGFQWNICCQALCPFLCLCVQKFKKMDTDPTRKLFLVSNERYGKNKTFLLRWYGIDFAPIKRYRPFCFFMIVYKEAKIIPLWSLNSLFLL